MRSWKFKALIVVLTVFCIYGLYAILFTDYIAERNTKRFLSEYGWETKKYHSVHEGTEPIDVELTNKFTDLYKMIFEASEKIGLNPEEYDGKIVDMYSYKLTAKGRKSQLSAGL